MVLPILNNVQRAVDELRSQALAFRQAVRSTTAVSCCSVLDSPTLRSARSWAG